MRGNGWRCLDAFIAETPTKADRIVRSQFVFPIPNTDSIFVLCHVEQSGRKLNCFVRKPGPFFHFRTPKPLHCSSTRRANCRSGRIWSCSVQFVGRSCVCVGAIDSLSMNETTKFVSFEKEYWLLSQHSTLFWLRAIPNCTKIFSAKNWFVPLLHYCCG